MPKVFNVLVVANSLSRGGAASGIGNLAYALKNAGHKVSYVAADEVLATSVMLRFFRLIERVCEVILFGREVHCIRLYRPTISLAEQVACAKPDVIQLGDISGNTIDVKELLSLQIPVIHRCSDFWPYRGAGHYMPARRLVALSNLFHKMMMPENLPNVTRVCPSLWLLEQLGRDSKAVADSVMIKNALSWHPLEFEQCVKPAMDECVLGFIAGNIWDERKGLKVLLNTLLNLVKSGDIKCRLKIYGNGRAKPLPPELSGRVEFCGKFSQEYEEMKLVYQSFHILVVPSFCDNSPNVLTEGFAFGTPAITRKGTGASTYMSPDRGREISFEIADDASFAGAVGEIVDNYEVMLKSVLSYALRELAPDVIAAQYSELYTGILRAQLAE